MASKQGNSGVFYIGMQNNGSLGKGTTITAVASVATNEGKVMDRSATLSMTKGTSKIASVSINKPKGQPTELKARWTF